MKVLVLTGESAGIGVELAIMLANVQLSQFYNDNCEICFLVNEELLVQRAKVLNLDIHPVYELEKAKKTPNSILIKNIALNKIPKAGEPIIENAQYVIEQIEYVHKKALSKEVDGIITCPVDKDIINQSGIEFYGVTTYLEKLSQVDKTVMLISNDEIKVVPLTVHIPLRDVASSISIELIEKTVQIINDDFPKHFGKKPSILVCALNPHGNPENEKYFEEKEIIAPALKNLKEKGIDINGPFAADSIFMQKKAKNADVFLGMYHDQILGLAKYAQFSDTINITLGLPYYRVGVGHGTAYDLVGSLDIDCSSLLTAILHLRQLIYDADKT